MAPDSATPSDEALDLIGAIAMHRQAMAQESGAVPARSEALQAHGPGGRHAANIAAVLLELVKVRNSPDPSAARTGYSRRNQWQVSQPGASRNFPRHKGRRTMGRAER